MAAPPRPAVDPGELIQALERRFDAPESAQALLGGLPASLRLAEDLRGPLEAPPWERLYKWLLEDPEGRRLRALLQAALNQAPDERTLRELAGRLGLADEEQVEVIGKAAQKQAEPEEVVEVVGKATESAQQQAVPQDQQPEEKDTLEFQPADARPVAQQMGLSDTLETVLDAFDLGSLRTLVEQTVYLAASHGHVADSVLLVALALQTMPEVRRTDVLNVLAAQREVDLKMIGEDPIDLLDLKEEYGIDSLRIPKVRPEPPYLTNELHAVLVRTGGFAGETSATSPSPLHLLTTLFSTRWASPPLVQTYLAERGCDLTPIRQAILGATDSSEPWARELREVYIPPAAGYISDSVDPKAPDRLDIRPEVEAISRVLMARQVQPPLSLGLFGDWGSGKSFFMAKMRQEVDALAADARALERRDGAPTAFCSRVVQIEFNAWHFADANLWASLVTHIYDELYRHLQGVDDEEAAQRQDLEDALKHAEGLVQAAEQELDDAKTAVDDAEDALAEKRREREAKERTLRDLLYDVRSLLAHNEQTRAELERAADALGYTEAKTSYEALQQAAGELQSFSKRVAAVGQRFIREPFAWLAIPFLIVVLLVPVGIALLAGSGWLDAWLSRLLEVTTLVGGVAAWIGTQIKRASPYIERIEAGFAAAKAEQERRAQQETQQEREALEAAREQERAAREHLRAMQAEYQRLQHELKEFSPSRRLARLVEERSRGTQYREHLGIISLIRQDFQRLSTLLRDAAEEHYERSADALRDEALVPPIQRIILYIDDLDRCRAERVVAVLEAVHLLMAFPLFVVVVGVDPRWLRRCLQLQYADLLDIDSDGIERAPGGVPVRSSTPQDYLEKIFQIPFALRPIEAPGYQKLVGDLLQPLAGDGREPGAHGVAGTPGATDQASELPSDGETGSLEADDFGSGGELDTVEATYEEDAAVDADDVREQQIRPASPVLTPEQLVFTAWEEAAIVRLAPLFQTPRAVKRFINIYRLLRSSLPADDVAGFEGTADAPGSYRVVLVLLAVVTGFPNLASPFLHRLHRWMQQADETEDWAVLLNVLAEPLVPADERDSADLVTEAQAAAWQGLVQRLRTASQDDFVPFPAADLHTILADWVPRIARYSFSVHLRPTL